MAIELIDNISDDVWDCFIQNSAQASVFSQSTFLNALEIPHDKLFLEVDGKTVASALIVEPDLKSFCAPYAYSLYQGIALAPIVGGEHKVVPKSLKIVDTLLSALAAKYINIGLCLHHSFQDLRSIQWFNYHEPELGKFDIDLYYTGIINLNKHVSFDEYLKTIRSVRRQEYKKSKKLNLSMTVSHDTEAFLDLYKLTFKRQNIDLKLNALNRVRSLVNAVVTSGMGRLVFCEDDAGRLHSAVVTLQDKECTYYMFGATDPELRSSGASSSLMLESIHYAFECNHLRFDMVGINSPQRGDFKTSFNAEPTPYYFVSLKR